MALNIALHKQRNADVVNCNFDDLYEWGYELLPDMKIFSEIKYFYKGISSTGNDLVGVILCPASLMNSA